MSASTGQTELAAKGCPNTMVVQYLVLHDPFGEKDLTDLKGHKGAAPGQLGATTVLKATRRLPTYPDGCSEFALPCRSARPTYYEWTYQKI